MSCRIHDEYSPGLDYVGHGKDAEGVLKAKERARTRVCICVCACVRQCERVCENDRETVRV